jgi:hypothetical protein
VRPVDSGGQRISCSSTTSSPMVRARGTHSPAQQVQENYLSIFASFGGDPPPLPTSDLEVGMPLLPLLVEVVTTSDLEASAPLLPLLVEAGATSDPRRTEGHCSGTPSFHSCFGLASNFLFPAWGCFCTGPTPRGGVLRQPRLAFILLAVVWQLPPHPSSCAGGVRSPKA